MSIHYGATKPRLARAVRAMMARLDFQQFGQNNDSYVWQGATACTHTICQSLYYIWFGKVITLNDVNRLAGMRPLERNSRGQPRGMNNRELQHFFDKTGLPYVVRFGLSHNQVLTYMNRGPVLYAMRYGSAPEWRGYDYQGHKARAPYAIHNGKTQLAGAESIRHAVLGLGYRQILSDATGKLVGFHVWRKEPNHNSPSRPERPPYDLITGKHSANEYNAYTTILGNTPYAAIPTRSLPLTARLDPLEKVELVGALVDPEDTDTEDVTDPLPLLLPEGEVPPHGVEPTDEDWDGGDDDEVPEG